MYVPRDYTPLPKVTRNSQGIKLTPTARIFLKVVFYAMCSVREFAFKNHSLLVLLLPSVVVEQRNGAVFFPYGWINKAFLV